MMFGSAAFPGMHFVQKKKKKIVVHAFLHFKKLHFSKFFRLKIKAKTCLPKMCYHKKI